VRALAAAEAKVRQNEAMVKQAELNLEYATVKAPSRDREPQGRRGGTGDSAGQPLMTVIPLDRVWITANFKETQLEEMRPGQRVKIEVDAYGGREFSGRSRAFAAATGSRFSLLPPDNATGNYVKVGAARARSDSAG
jgi:membrane fusion protein (multidrug efflux system)